MSLTMKKQSVQEISEQSIKVNPFKCTGCRRCQLGCSFKHYNYFSVNGAFIKIHENTEGVHSITFEVECDRCGFCVKYCVYGALKIRKEV